MLFLKIRLEIFKVLMYNKPIGIVGIKNDIRKYIKGGLKIMADRKQKGGVIKITAVAAVLVIVFILANQLGFVGKLKNIGALQEWFQGLGFIGYAVYLAIYVIVAVFMFPASAITIVAGITFGSVLGGILALLGATIGAAAAFIIAKYVARDAIVNKFGRNPIFKKIENGVKENGTSFLILTRLVPLFPYNIQNYAYGVTPMKLSTFIFVSLATMAPGAFIYAFMAGEIVTKGISVRLLIQFAAAGLILFGVSLIPKLITRKKVIKEEAF